MGAFDDVSGRFAISDRTSKGASLGWLDLRLGTLTLDVLVLARIKTIVAELVDNVIQHGGGRGWLSLEVGDSLLTIQVQDFGSGIEDVNLALQDHFSTKGTLGLGLPGVKRLAQGLEIESVPRTGTLVAATVTL